MGCLSQLFGILFFAFLFRAVAWLVRELFGGGQGGSEAGHADAPSEAAMRQRLKYVYYLMALLGKIAKADGRVSEREIAGVERIFRELQLSGEALQLAQEAFREGKAEPGTWRKSAQALADLCGNFEVRVVTFRFLARVACAEGDLPPPAREILLGAAQIFGLPLALVQLILRPMMGGAAFGSGERTQRERAYWPREDAAAQRARDLALLGLAPNATPEEIKRAYRQKVKELHPDRLQAQGLPESLLKQASDRMAEINAAYERLK